MAGLLAGLVVTLVAGLVISTAQWVRADRHASRETELRAAMARDLYTSDLFAIQQAWETGNVEQMDKLLRRHIPDPDQTDWRGFEWHVFRRLSEKAGDPVLQTLPLRGAVWDLAATPDGQTVAALFFDPEEGRAQVTLWDAATGWVPRTFDGPHGGRGGTFIRSLALSPDGRVFATRSRFDHEGREGPFIDLRDAATGEPWRPSLKQPEEYTADVLGMAFSHDGKILVSGHTNRTIRLWDLETRRARTIEGPDGQAYDIRGIAISNDGTRVATACSDMMVRLWDVRAGRVVHTFPRFGESFVLSVAFSPGEAILATGTLGNVDTLKLWDADTGQPLPTPEGRPLNTDGWPAFSPDGPGGVSSTNTIKLWKVGTGELGDAEGHSYVGWSIVFREAGRRLASGRCDRMVKLWDLTRAGGEPEILTANAGRGNGGLVFTDNGRALASVSGDTVTSWDVATGRVHPPLEAPAEAPPGIFGIALSPDGGTLAAACYEPMRRSCGTWRPVGSAAHPHHGVASVAFSPGRRSLATGTLGSATP